MTVEELNERLLFFSPEIDFALNDLGYVHLVMKVDAFNGHINWSVKSGDHYTDFLDDFNAAARYFCGEENENT